MKLVSRSSKNRKTNNPPPQSNPPERSAPPVNRGPAPVNNAPQNRERMPQNQNRVPQDQNRVPQDQNRAPQNQNRAPQNTAASRNPAAPGSNGNAAATAAKPVKKKRSPLIAVLITLLVLVVLAASGFVALGFYVDSLDTIFPNVWAEGFNVSGLTLQEAIYLLKNEGYENNADGISITVVFPDDTSFSVTGNEVGLSFNASEAAAAAFAFGREDSFFENEITFIRSLFDRTELNDLSTPDYDDNIIRSLAAEYTQQFNTTVFSGSLDRNDEYITVTRGTGLHSAREDVVISLALETLSQAISEHSELRVYYSPEEDIEDSVESQIRELRELFEYIHDDAVSAQWDVETLSATASSPGRTFDLERAIADLQSAASGGTVVIHIEELEPALTQEFFESLLYAHLLAGSTTRELSGRRY